MVARVLLAFLSEVWSGKVAAGFCVGGLPGNLRRGQKSRMAQSQVELITCKVTISY